jgi:uncharacterized protein (DUF1501 family)
MASTWPRLTFANLPTDNRFILVILRGALDGLSAVPPYGDPAYKARRSTIALSRPGEGDGTFDLNGFFGLHPALDGLMPLYQNKQLAVFHATSSPYRERSHFDAQNLLENGTTHAGGSSGWLNRALEVLQGGNGSAIAINQQVPLVLQGELVAASWAPKSREVDASSAYMTKIASLYKNDPMFASSFDESMRMQDVASQALTQDDMKASGRAKGSEQLYAAAKAAAVFLKKDNGPRVAVLEASGWDTHARQGGATGQLATRLHDLGNALGSLPQALGADVWNKTVVMVVTEFGRTAAENGTGGTDHGTGGVAFVMGGSVRGGQVFGQWPGLGDGNLYQGRDVMPTTDMRSIFKTVLYAHLRAPVDALESTVFPDSHSATMIRGLMA